MSWLGSLGGERAPVKAAAPVEPIAAPVRAGADDTAAAPPPDDLLPGPPSADPPDTTEPTDPPADPPVESVTAPDRSAAGGGDAATPDTGWANNIWPDIVGAEIPESGEGASSDSEPRDLAAAGDQPGDHEGNDATPVDATRTEGGHIPPTPKPRAAEPRAAEPRAAQAPAADPETAPALAPPPPPAVHEPAPDDAQVEAASDDLDHLHEVVDAAARECDRTPFSPRLRGRLKAALAAEAEALESRGFASYEDYVTTGEPRTAGTPPIDATQARAPAAPPTGETERLASQLAEARGEIRRTQRQHTEALATVATEREDWERTHLDIIRTLRQDLAAARRQTHASRVERGVEQDELDNLRARAERDLERSREVAQRDAAAVAGRAARDLATMRAAAESDAVEIRETAERTARASEESARRGASEIEDRARAEAEEIRAEAEVTAEGLRQLAEHSGQVPPAPGEPAGARDAAGDDTPDAADARLARRGELALELEQLSAELATMTEARDAAELDLASLDDRVERQRAKRRRIRTEVSRRREQFRREREAVDKALVRSRHEAAATQERAAAEARRLTEAADARARAVTEAAETTARSLTEVAATERDRMLEAATQLADATLERARVAMARARTDLTALEPRIGRVADDAALIRDQIAEALKALDPPEHQ